MNVTKLSSITIPANRQRREFDPQKLEELKASIELSPARNTQLLHPPVLRREGDSLILVAGETRLKAISDIFALGGSFLYSGKVFPAEAGEIPYTDLGELSPLEAMEAELDENIRRKDLTWQEHAAAVKALHELRTAQKEGKVVDVVSKMNTGGKYDSKAFKKSVGLNGVGTKAVNALSTFFKVRSVRDGQTKVAEFSKGNLIEEFPISESTERNGTETTFVPDMDIFPHFKFRKEYIERMLRNYAYLNPGLKIAFNGEVFYSENGLKDLSKSFLHLWC